MASITIDLITYDENHHEFVLYLIEDGPWPNADESWDACLEIIQGRIFNAIDVVIDGYLASQYPDSLGKKIRIQIDSPHGCPLALQELVHAIEQYLEEDARYNKAICESAFISGLRITTGVQMGRFQVPSFDKR